VDFGNVAAGHAKTSGVRVTNTGSADCNVSDVQIAAGSDPAFSIPTGQVTSLTLSAGRDSFPVGVVFAPAMAGRAFAGKLTFQMSPPGMPVEIPLAGSSLPSCPDPLPDGTCPVAT